jgi:Icc protein
MIRRAESAVNLLLATGDLSNDASATAYRRLASRLDTLGLPNAWLAGNHDSRQQMLDSVGTRRLPRLVRLGSWALVLLDSSVPGQVGGTLGEAELQLLQELLRQAQDAKHLIVCVHHQPVPVGCEWLDEQQISDCDELIGILAGEKRLRAVVWGHVHQAFEGSDARLPNVRLLSAPSTCIQFAPGSSDFKLDSTMPGYRWFELHPDGRVATGVERVANMDLGADMCSTGY